MKQDIKERWLAAIPTYKKCEGKLRSGDRYCALGVLCDLYRQEVGGEWRTWRGCSTGGASGFIFSDGVHQNAGTLPRGVARWAELDTDDPVLKTPERRGAFGEITTLSDVNDLSGDDWGPVLAAIRENL